MIEYPQELEKAFTGSLQDTILDLKLAIERQDRDATDRLVFRLGIKIY